MKLISQVTDNPLQKQKFVLEDGTFFIMTMYFVPLQQGWFITELTYGDFILRGLRICNNVNMLYQWKNLIPFGLACLSVANREPSLQQDFSSGASNLYVLNQTDVEEYAEYLSLG